MSVPKVPNVLYGLLLSAVAVGIQTYFPDAPWLQAANLVVVALLKALEVNITVEDKALPPGAQGTPRMAAQDNKWKRWLLE